jgi:hypothetical protein
VAIKSLVAEDPSPSWERILDMHMLAIHAGAERPRQLAATISENSRCDG